MSDQKNSAQTRIIAKKKRKKTGAFFWITRILLLGLVGGLIWLAAGQIRQMAVHQMIKTYQVELGTLEKTLPVQQALIARDETVFWAPGAGALRPVVEEGQRVAQGEIVALIQNNYQGSQAIRASHAGVVCYHTDGLEGILTLEQIKQLKLRDLAVSTFPLKETAPGMAVEQGQPVFKIVNNLAPFLIWLETDTEHVVDFPPVGKKIRLRLAKEEFEAVLADLGTQGIIAEAILRVDRGDLLHQRELNLELILQTVKGLTVPNQALTEQGGIRGVYKAATRGYRWTPVTVVLQDTEWSVVEGLARGDFIVINPSLLNKHKNATSGQE